MSGIVSDRPWATCLELQSNAQVVASSARPRRDLAVHHGQFPLAMSLRVGKQKAKASPVSLVRFLLDSVTEVA